MTSSEGNELLSKESALICLRQASDDIKQIQQICRVPSVFFGVLHDGEVVFYESLGVRDKKTNQQANSDTLYDIRSVSKCFVSALARLVVSEGKLD